MKISFEKKILLGFIINVLVVVAAGWVFVSRLNKQRDLSLDSKLIWIELSLFVLSIILLTIVYFIIRAQLRAKTVSQNLLLENKQLLQSIIDNTSNPIFIKKINGEYLLINKECESLFKISNEQIIGKTDYDFLPKETADAYRNSDLEVVKALRELKTEETIQQSDGPHAYIAVKYPLYDSTGRIYAIGGILTDITERKKSEESLKEAGKFFTMSSDIIVIASKDKFIKINSALSRTLGYSDEELLSNPFITYVHPDDYEITQKEIEKLQDGALTIKFKNRWICKDGSIKWLVWSASHDPSAGLFYAIARDVTAQKEIDDSLIAADNFFNMTYDMLVIAKGEYFVKVNPAFTRTLGYSLNEMGKKPFLSFSHPDDAKASIDALSKLKKGESMVNYRARALCKDGSYKWLDWSTTIDVETGIMYAVARDVTELVENEEQINNYTQKLKDNDQQIQTLYENAPDAVIIIDAESTIVKWNPKAESVFGWKTTEVVGKPLYEFIIPAQHREAHKNGMKRYLETGIGPILNKSIEIEAINKEGKEFPVLLSISSAKVDEKYLFIGSLRDITENKRIVNELYENEEKLRLIIENISEGILVANAKKEIVMANDMANEIFGIEEDAKISLDLTDHFQLYYPDEKTIFPSQNLPMQRALNGEATDDVDVVLWNPNSKQKKRVLISGKPLVDQNNGVVAAVVTIKDISKYKQLEEELKETESKYRKLIGYKKGDDLAI